MKLSGEIAQKDADFKVAAARDLSDFDVADIQKKLEKNVRLTDDEYLREERLRRIHQQFIMNAQLAVQSVLKHVLAISINSGTNQGFALLAFSFTASHSGLFCSMYFPN